MKKTLLSVGTNRTLLGIRNALFLCAGYGVVSVRTGTAAETAIDVRALDAVVIGHSLARPLKERITDRAKAKDLPVIVLHAAPYDRPVQRADVNLCGIDGASRIMSVLNKLL